MEDEWNKIKVVNPTSWVTWRPEWINKGEYKSRTNIYYYLVHIILIFKYEYMRIHIHVHVWFIYLVMIICTQYISTHLWVFLRVLFPNLDLRMHIPDWTLNLLSHIFHRCQIRTLADAKQYIYRSLYLFICMYVLFPSFLSSSPSFYTRALSNRLHTHAQKARGFAKQQYACCNVCGFG